MNDTQGMLARLFYFFATMFVFAMLSIAYQDYSAQNRHKLYLVTSTSEAAVETIGNADNVFLDRAQAEAAAQKESSHVYEITISEK